MKYFFIAVSALGLVAMAGCMPSETTSPASDGPEAYQYKGRPDPLMAASASDRATKLSERFKLIQARQ